jgi:transcriptional regulator with XRE-family HTH domain
VAYRSVKGIRQRMGLELDDFAKLFPVSTRTVRRWEADEVAPSPMAIARIRELERDAAVAPDGQQERDVAGEVQDRARRTVGKKAPAQSASPRRRPLSFLT